MFLQFLVWYLVILLIHLAALPLTLRLFAALPDRGYAFGRGLGILLVGYLFWLGYSLGLIRNEVGGAWLSLLIVAGVAFYLGRSRVADLRSGALRLDRPGVVMTEAIFFIAFLLWATVRAYSPSATHTEQPMDLMFMNSIWTSPTFPPQDAWLAGYPISYYYFGYWLLTTVGRLAAQPPEVAYNLGQASWWGLLLIGSFGVVYNLLAANSGRGKWMGGAQFMDAGASRAAPILGGVLAALAVGVTGNAQSVMEWLYANGWPVEALARWFSVRNFPEGASVTGQWFISQGEWWWWRSSRVIQDLDLMGQHIEVIDEFPIFSYVLGDNHPHVLAMPFALVVVGLALAYFWRKADVGASDGWRGWLPTRDLTLLCVITLATGSLVFFNTWDFPPYWLLFMAATLMTTAGSPGRIVGRSAVLGAIILLGALILYFPYFLTAQSQAGGFAPNYFNPTRLRQFMLMFGAFMLTTGALLLLAQRQQAARLWMIAITAALVLGTPLLFLASSAALAFNTEIGRSLLASVRLPEGASSHLPFFLQRWTTQPWTFLLVGSLFTMAIALLWARLAASSDQERADDQRFTPTTFVLLLTAIGLLLTFAPEFIFLRDNFGTRMNTIFKFYYQAWLLLGLSAAFTIVRAFQSFRLGRSGAAAALIAAPGLALILAGLIFPLAGAYSKTNGFSLESPTFDATAYLSQYGSAELAAVRWLRENAPPGARVAEAKGRSYASDMNRISTMTGRSTLLGWDGHESQWRGRSYGEMAAGRPEALDALYRMARSDELPALLDEWQIDYVFVGPAERREYGMTPESEERLQTVMNLVFEEGDVRIYQRR
jgi:YYY domain-containing protein